MRPRSPACLPIWALVPQMMSSTSAVRSELRSASAPRTAAPRCCGCMSASAPLPTLPMPRGVRQASMIKASVMFLGLLRNVGRPALRRPLMGIVSAGSGVGKPLPDLGRDFERAEPRLMVVDLAGQDQLVGARLGDDLTQTALPRLRRADGGDRE